MTKITKIAFCTLCVFLSASLVWSQKKTREDFYGYSNIDLLRSKVKRHSLLLTVGATNMLTKDDRRVQLLEGTTNQEYFFRSNGKWAGMFELGMMHFTKKNSIKFFKIDYYDWSIGFKNFKGWEETTLILRNNQNATATSEFGKGEFSLGYLTGRFTVHHAVKLTRKITFDHGLGANLDYRILGNARGDNSGYQPIVLPTTQDFQRNFLAQIHYELGFRLKAINLVHITPMIHVPVISAFQWAGGRGTINWFSSKYQPWLLKFKIMIPQVEKQGKCPSAYGNPDDERRNKEFLEGK
jgi:hypothetical protein